MNRVLWPLACCATAMFATLAITRPASATARFPSQMYFHLYSSYTVTPYEPPCSVCHLRGSTGPGTAQTPFALSMKARGMQPGNNSSLLTALDAMNRDHVDSDGDGIADIQEIEDDTDPNTPAPVSLSGQPGPNAGCGGGQKADSVGRAPASAVALLGSLIVVWARRKNAGRRVRRVAPGSAQVRRYGPEIEQF